MQPDGLADALAHGRSSRSRPATSSTACTRTTSGQRAQRPRLTSAAASADARERGRSCAANVWTHLAATYDGADRAPLRERGARHGSTPCDRRDAGVHRRRCGSAATASGTSASPASIDEVRIYNRALGGAEIQADMGTPVGPPPPIDTQAPGAPAGLGGDRVVSARSTLTWRAATDNTGVDRYNVHRSTTAGFTPTAANRDRPADGHELQRLLGSRRAPTTTASPPRMPPAT